MSEEFAKLSDLELLSLIKRAEEELEYRKQASREKLKEEIEQKIRRVAERLTALFVERYVKNHFEYLPTTEHILLKKAYTRNGNIQNTDTERDALKKYFLYELSKLNPVFLCKLIHA